MVKLFFANAKLVNFLQIRNGFLIVFLAICKYREGGKESVF
jgi:hypothetical protein